MSDLEQNKVRMYIPLEESEGGVSKGSNGYGSRYESGGTGGDSSNGGNGKTDGIGRNNDNRRNGSIGGYNGNKGNGRYGRSNRDNGKKGNGRNGGTEGGYSAANGRNADKTAGNGSGAKGTKGYDKGNNDNNGNRRNGEKCSDGGIQGCDGNEKGSEALYTVGHTITSRAITSSNNQVGPAVTALSMVSSVITAVLMLLLIVWYIRKKLNRWLRRQRKSVNNVTIKDLESNTIRQDNHSETHMVASPHCSRDSGTCAGTWNPHMKEECGNYAGKDNVRNISEDQEAENKKCEDVPDSETNIYFTIEPCSLAYDIVTSNQTTIHNQLHRDDPPTRDSYFEATGVTRR